jgi:hypothetical protein
MNARNPVLVRVRWTRIVWRAGGFRRAATPLAEGGDAAERGLVTPSLPGGARDEGEADVPDAKVLFAGGKNMRGVLTVCWTGKVMSIP